MAIGKDKVNIKISLHKEAFNLIDKYAIAVKKTKSEIIENVVCAHIIALVQRVKKEQEEKK